MSLPAKLPLTRQDAIKFYETELQKAVGKSQEHYTEAQRWLGRNDLFYLLVSILGRKDVNRDWLFDRCREVQAEPDGMLDLWSREHYKSTIITFALSIQDILNDPEVTIGIFSHTKSIARAFLKQIKREFETNEKLKSLYPDVLYANPQKESPKWSEDGGLIVKRKTNPKEGTLEAHGLVDGQPTSKHFSILVYDDVVTIESVTTPDMISKVADAWALSLSLGTEGGIKRHIGTRYHFNDTYKTIMDRGAAKARIHTATVDGKINGEPVLMTRESLEEKRRTRGSYIFACQYMQNPSADSTQGFQEEWLSYWPAHHIKNLNTYILVDPASEKKKTSDYSTFFVIGLGDDNIYRVITMVRDRLNLTERANTLFSLHKDYQPLAVGYEKYGMQADIEHFKDKMKRENYTFRIKELGGQMPKNDRIKKLVPLFEQFRILLPETCMRRNYEGTSQDLTAIFRDDEYLAFPLSAHDDMLDCLARIQDPAFPMRAPMAKKKFSTPRVANSKYRKLRR